MSTDIDNTNNKKPGNGKILIGLLLLIMGTGFLLQQLNFFFIPHYFFGWPMWLIAWGIYIGSKNNFRSSSWLIMVIVGIAFLSDDAFPGHNLKDVIWPIAIIGFGLWLILRRNQTWDEGKWAGKWNKHQYRYGNPVESVITPVTPADPDTETTSVPPPGSTAVPPTGGSTNIPPTGGSRFHNPDDFLDTVSVFGGVNKTIFSKNFQGGEIVNIFGGAELDFTQADINGRVIIDITQIFGGTKIIVPANWQVIPDMAAVFAGIDDKRLKTRATSDSNKILVIKGVSIFAGVDVRSY